MTVRVGFARDGSIVAVDCRADFDVGELWPFLLLGTLVPGFSQLLVVRAVQAAGASRAGILFGMAPLFSALIAIADPVQQRHQRDHERHGGDPCRALAARGRG